jgi:hypothetical protein
LKKFLTKGDKNMCFFSKAKREERKRKKEEKLKAKQTAKTEQEEKVVATNDEVEEISVEQTEEIVVQSNESDGKKIRPINYHIARRDDGKWQVKRAKGGRALKLFATQAEAIAFAKERAVSMDASITIHKKDGKIRKQRYDKKN